MVSKLTIEKEIDTVEKEIATVEKETTNKLIITTAMLLIHIIGHWLADEQLVGFATAFTLSFHDKECSRKPPNTHQLGCYRQV